MLGSSGRAAPSREERRVALTAGAQRALRCFSRGHRNNEKEAEGLSERGKFGSQVPSSLDLLPLLCLLSVSWQEPSLCYSISQCRCFTFPQLWVLLYSCHSAAAFPSRTPLLSRDMSYQGTWVFFSPWDSSSSEAHYANQSQGQHLTCTVWLGRVSNLQCSFQALVQVSNEGLIPKVLLQLLLREN